MPLWWWKLVTLTSLHQSHLQLFPAGLSSCLLIPKHGPSEKLLCCLWGYPNKPLLLLSSCLLIFLLHSFLPIPSSSWRGAGFRFTFISPHPHPQNSTHLCSCRASLRSSQARCILKELIPNRLCWPHVVYCGLMQLSFWHRIPTTNPIPILGMEPTTGQ